MFSMKLIELPILESSNFAQFEKDFSFEPEMENDCALAILMDICEILSTYSNLKFEVSGFGIDWSKIDIGTDLSTIIEPLPTTIRNLKKKREASIDFFEQQTEREIVFQRFTKTKCLASCRTLVRVNRVPQKRKIGKSENLELDYVINELTNVFSEFLRIAKKYCPERFEDPYLQDWIYIYRLE